MSYWARLLQRRKEEVVSIHVERDISLRFTALAFEDLQLYDWWRVDRPPVCRSCISVSDARRDEWRATILTFGTGTACSSTLRLLEHLHVISDLPALLGRPHGRALRLVVDGDDVRALHALRAALHVE